VIGPGLIVMLADTDAGSVVTAAQSGARWGYRLLLLELILIPILYVVQELTVRLGIATGRGHAELIRLHFGAGWAWFSVSTLVVVSIGALVTELSGLAGAGLVFGIPPLVSVGGGVGLLVLIVWTGSYRSIEKMALLLGAFELAFLVVAWRAQPGLSALGGSSLAIPFSDSGYLYLAAANVGAVVMPWMIFYQQSAVVDKGLRRSDLSAARFDTALGAVVTQLIMIAILVATAATIGATAERPSLNSIQEISASLTPFLGTGVGHVTFALAVSGAALLAATVVSLTVAWTLGEVTGYKRSLGHSPREAPWFYGVYTISLVAAASIVLAVHDLVGLSVAVEVMNAMLLPIALGFLFLLAVRALPPPFRLGRYYTVLVAVVISITSAFGVFAATSGLTVG
jgi:NRAMP (natural resistance-associated macrophage protein)-like metal ion transporter